MRLSNELRLAAERLGSEGPHLYMKALFNEGEFVCAGNLYTTTISTTDSALRSEGPFISINPLLERRADAHVSAHRNFLIEMDGESSLDLQYQAIKRAGLPYTTLTWSGGKSLHFVVCMEQTVAPYMWRKWARALVKAVAGADPSTTNPSRFTRLPNAYRQDKDTHQTLIEVGARIANNVIEEYVQPHLESEPTNYRSIYSELLGLKGLDAAHPLTKAFINGTHPCNTGRNVTLFKCAADLKDVGLSIEEADELLAGPAENLGLDHREIITTIRSAYRRKP